MGDFSSFVNTFSAVRVRRAAVLLLVVLTCSVELAELSTAQSRQVSRRAGSTFIDPSDSGRRPYRRQQFAGQTYDANFDYRLEEEFNDFDISQTGFCVGGNDCCCGDCVGSCSDDTCCNDSCCGDACGGGACGCGAGGGSAGGLAWLVGFEWSFVQPRFSENLAFTTLVSDGATTFDFTDSEFDYDLELTPRVWLEGSLTDSWGWRFTYWQFDHQPAIASAQAPANGFGSITPPAFGDIDISAVDPAETLTASSELDVFTLDLEAMKYARINRWQFGVGCGVRYASTEQGYFATLSDGVGDIGSIDFTHDLEGFGPTFSAYGARPLLNRINIVGAARASVLFGDSASRLSAVEPLGETTTITTNRDDLLPIGEARLGVEWLSLRRPSGLQWVLSSALEGQIWGNAGNASSEDADLGFYGFNFGLGFIR